MDFHCEHIFIYEHFHIFIMTIFYLIAADKMSIKLYIESFIAIHFFHK